LDYLWKYAAFLSFEFWTQRPVLFSSYFLLAAEPRDLPGLWENFVRSWFMNNWTPARDILVREVHMLVLWAESIVDNPCEKDLIGTYFKLERLQYTRRNWYCTEKKEKQRWTPACVKWWELKLYLFFKDFCPTNNPMYYRQALDCSLILKKEINWNNELVSSKKSDGALVESQGGRIELNLVLCWCVWCDRWPVLMQATLSQYCLASLYFRAEKYGQVSFHHPTRTNVLMGACYLFPRCPNVCFIDE